MKAKYCLILAILFSACFGSVEAQTSDKDKQVNINVQLRPRAEYRNGYMNPLGTNDLAAGFVNQRSRLSVDYQYEDLTVFASLQNVSTWGENPPANRNSNTIMNEAWAQLKSSEGFFMKFGRQVLNYNDGRIFGGVDWHQAGVFHDALKMGYLNNEHALDLVVAYNQSLELLKGGAYFNPAGVMPYKNMQLVNYQFNGIAGLTPSLLVANMGYEVGTLGAPETVYLQTMGFNVVAANPVDGLRLQGTGYYQTGERGVTREKVSAYMLALRADYNVDKSTKIFAGVDYLSGEEHNASSPNSSYNAFNTLHATNHAFYGSMDVFIASPFQNGMNLGVIDKYIGVTYSPKSKYQFLARYHHFSMAANAFTDANVRVKKGMASEIDLQFDYTVMKDVKLICGYSTLLGGESLKFAKGGDPSRWQDWAFVTINVNPRVFSTKW